MTLYHKLSHPFRSRSQSGKSAHLEIRLGAHRPDALHLQDGNKLHEPPAIEGYLDRIKPNTQIKEPVYLASHDGNLFYLTPAYAQPPAPPGVHSAAGDAAEISLRQTEVRRGVQQVMHATGVCDLRSILTIRRASHLAPQHSHSAGNGGNGQGNVGFHEENDEWLGTWAVDRTESDDEDDGGEEGLGKSTDKLRVKMKRSFELLLSTGNVVRFEVRKLFFTGVTFSP